MNTKYRDFCVKYKEKLTKDKDIEERKIDLMFDCRDRISFNITAFESAPGYQKSLEYNGSSLFTLDDEDLEYLYNKYSKKISSELEENIAKLKESYGL